MVNKHFGFAFVLVFILLLVSPATETYAGPAPWIFTVDDTTDAPDFVHNSVCSAGAVTGGGCTLRAAIEEANKCSDAAGACDGGVIIRVPPGTYTLTIPPAGVNDNSTGDLDISISDELSMYIIEGTDPANPPVIDANGLDRVFQIGESSTPVTFRDLAIRGGNLAITEGDYLDKNGAGISNQGNLSLENVVIENNQITCFPDDFGQCYTGVGGGLFSINQLSMNSTTVQNNSAIRGGGVFLTGTQQMEIYNSTFSGNQALSNGGGILNYGTVNIENSTISNNAAKYTGGINNNGTMNLYNVTIASNISLDGVAANLVNSSELNIRNSIIAYPLSPYTTSNCQNSATWTPSGNNLYSDSSCVPGANDFPGTDPKLTPLAWLGGPTMTRGLLTGSPAHNAGTTFCLDSSSNTISADQRGANRDSQCDLGAFEGVAYGVYMPVIRR